MHNHCHWDGEGTGGLEALSKIIHQAININVVLSSSANSHIAQLISTMVDIVEDVLYPLGRGGSSSISLTPAVSFEEVG